MLGCRVLENIACFDKVDERHVRILIYLEVIDHTLELDTSKWHSGGVSGLRRQPHQPRPARSSPALEPSGNPPICFRSMETRTECGPKAKGVSVDKWRWNQERLCWKRAKHQPVRVISGSLRDTSSTYRCHTAIIPMKRQLAVFREIQTPIDRTLTASLGSGENLLASHLSFLSFVLSSPSSQHIHIPSKLPISIHRERPLPLALTQTQQPRVFYVY